MINYNYDYVPFFKEIIGNPYEFNSNIHFKINNRRYLGNKSKLVNFINSVVVEEIKEFNSFCDLFAGTGSVSAHFNNFDKKIIVNDILFSNYIVLKAFFSVTQIDYKVLQEKIEHLNNMNNFSESYFFETFGGKYFSIENAMKIGNIREEIDKISENENEKYLLLTSLIFAADKVANTVGHYDAFCKKILNKNKLFLLMPFIRFENNFNNEIYRVDAVELAQQVKCDVLYLDPPYNSRQYNSAYHVLENLVKWEKPEVKGIAKKMEMNDTKSRFCTKLAPFDFKKIINKCNCKYIIVSYNNTANTMHSRSNALISDSFIIDEMRKIGEVKVFSMDYKGYTTGKAINMNNKERLFFCKVG
ncbi:MAG TPA: DNA adenine methylase [Melioribacteraceae bacterium]|nr:DNA adenine methylase [Melioribacteraceae bacterium]